MPSTAGLARLAAANVESLLGWTLPNGMPLGDARQKDVREAARMYLQSAQQRQIFENVAKEAGEKYLEISAAERDTFDRKAQNDHGVTIIVPPAKPWLDVAKTVFDRFEAENILPKGLIAQVQAIK